MAFRFPHTLVLLVAGILLAAALTWVIPAGQLDRRADERTGKEVAVPNTYHAVPGRPVGPFRAAVLVPKGLIAAADVVFFVFLVGGAFAVVDKTGALRQAVDWLAHRLRNHRGWVVPVVCAVFALGGVLENLQEEIVAMVPVLLLLCRRLGFDPLTAAGMSIGAASVGSAFSPVNPFQVLIAQKAADLPPFSALGYRTAFLVVAVAFWAWGVQRHARGLPRPETVPDDPQEGNTPTARSIDTRGIIILGLVALTFGIFIAQVLAQKWGFEEMSAAFFVMGIAAGFVGRLGINGTAEAFVEGFRSMTFAALLIGFARTIYVVLAEGKVVDTFVNGLFAPLGHLPVAVSAVGMVLVQTLVHVPVPSVSGQAVLTLPILAPLSDLLGLSRQVAVLAYQYGAGLCELLTPTNGALMAILSACGVRYDHWLRFTWRLYLGLLALGVAAVLLGVVTGLR